MNIQLSQLSKELRARVQKEIAASEAPYIGDYITQIGTLIENTYSRLYVRTLDRVLDLVERDLRVLEGFIYARYGASLAGELQTDQTDLSNYRDTLTVRIRACLNSKVFDKDNRTNYYAVGAQSKLLENQCALLTTTFIQEGKGNIPDMFFGKFIIEDLFI